MKTVRSADGTAIAFDELGEGPSIILSAGAFNDRSTTAPLAEELSRRFTVLNYDRRGRGDSGDAASYSIQRETEDIEMLIVEAGGTAALFGYSSGAVLALHAAGGGLAISSLALYEPPFLVDESRPRPGADLAERLAELIAEGRRGDAVELYQSEGIGLPPEVVAQLRDAPFRPGLEAIAHTLVYDATITGDLTMPAKLISSIDVPALLIDGENSWGFLRSGTKVAAEALPQGRLCTLVGESHDINPTATASVLEEFLLADYSS
jgi:pimeloyl-ACP methyl ester carboxylesterase